MPSHRRSGKEVYRERPKISTWLRSLGPADTRVDDRRRTSFPRGSLARTHLTNAVGRLRMAGGMDPGRNACITESRLAVPETALTRAARKVAEDTLPPTLLHHSYRTYRFGPALGELDGQVVPA